VAQQVGPELSSLATALGELTARVTAIADTLAGTEADSVAVELYQVERALREALRRLERLARP
jgi:5-hydroxyisourate hydrolase-like protein (transthyretin family)